MNKFQNAAKGISKLFTGELITLFSVVMFGGTGIFALMAIESANVSMGALALGFLVAGLIILIIGAILSLVGIFTAGKDSSYYKSAGWVVILGIVLTVVAAFELPSALQIVCKAFTGVADILAMVLVVEGTNKLVSSAELTSFGKIISGFAVLAILGSVGADALAKLGMAAAVCTILSAVFHVAYYVLYLVFLGKAKRELMA